MSERKPNRAIYSQNLEGISERKVQQMSSVEEKAKSGTAARSRGWPAGWREQGTREWRGAGHGGQQWRR